MKKFLLLILVLLTMVVVSCGKDATEETPTTDNPSQVVYTYNDFTAGEKALFKQLFNEVIPFVANNEYYVNTNSNSVIFYTVGNSAAEYETYRSTLVAAGYQNTAWNVTDGYTYEKGGIKLVVNFNEEGGKTYLTVTAVIGSGDVPSVDIPSGGNTNPSNHLYTDFSNSEKALFTQYIGAVIPFIANDEYYVEGYYDETDYENGMCVITVGNTQAEFNAYLNSLKSNGYVFDSQEADTDGDTWYTYVKNDDIVVSAVWYEYEGDSYVEIYVYSLTLSDDGSGSGTTQPSTSAISALLAEAASLSSGQSLSGDRTITATVSEIKESYTSQFKNISFVLSDGVAEILVWRAKGDCASTLKVGDTVTVTGQVINYNGTIEFQYPKISTSGSGSGNQGGGTSSHKYTGFTNSEKSLFTQYVGEVIPFLSNDEYYLEGYYEETDYENGLCFYTVGNTQAEFNAYLNTLVSAGYEYYAEEDDDYGDTWYTYIKNDDIVLDAVCYEYEGDSYVEIYVYSLTLSGDGSGSGSDSGSGSGTVDADLITNAGAGLPSSSNGVYNVDFTDATYVKNVADQGYYLGGCPTTGDVKVLVIPVEFSDRTAASLGYSIDKINTAFNGLTGTTDYLSVSEYYFTSSYGKLDLDFVVLDTWFRPSNNSSYYLNQTMDYYGYDVECGDQMIIHEALTYLESRMDLSQFDSDDNGYIDAIVLINTLDIDADVTMKWAYRYWNIYEDNSGNFYEYDGVSANDYLWAGYKFLLEEYNSTGDTVYNDNNMNTYTFIHEFGHVLGADDYYDTAYVSEPLKGCDIMDSMLGDHNAFTKFNLGWITTSRLVVASNSVTLTLEDFSKNGDTIVIANNWDATLGAYQEYYIVVYYKNTGLNGGDAGYFVNDGIVVYHVNASLYSEEIDGEVYYDIYYNNTDASDSYGTPENLIEFAYAPNGNIVHTQGTTSSKTTQDDSGNIISYYFTVDSITSDSATITFTKNN